MKNRRVFFDIDKLTTGPTRGCLVLVDGTAVTPGSTPRSELLIGRVSNPDDWLPLGPVLGETGGDLAFVHRDVSVVVNNPREDLQEMTPGDGGVTAADFTSAVAAPESRIGLLWTAMTRPSTAPTAEVTIDDTVYKQVCAGISNWWRKGNPKESLEVIPSHEYEDLAVGGAFGEDGIAQLHALPHRNFSKFETVAEQMAEQKAAQEKALKSMEEARRATREKYEASQTPVLTFALIILILCLGFLGLFVYLSIEYKKDVAGGASGNIRDDL